MNKNLFEQYTGPSFTQSGEPPPGAPPLPPPPPPQFPGGMQGGSAGTLAIISLILGILANTICCGSFVLGIAAWIMGKIELNKIDDGESSEAGRNLAKIGMWLGIANVILCFLFWIMIIIYIVFLQNLSNSNYH